MTRSDLVMVEREVLANAVSELKNLLAMCEGEVPSLLEDHFSYPKIVDAIEAGERALQSVEGGVQGSIATKQESCPESAPRSETAVREILLHEALVEAAKALCKHTPLFIDGFGGARLYSEELRDVWRKQAIAAAECVIRAYLDACTKSAPGFKASHNTGERDPSVMPGCPGADTKSDGGSTPGETVADQRSSADANASSGDNVAAGVLPGPSDQLTKTPSADRDAGNLRGLADPNHPQPHAVSQGWRDDMENAPRDRPVFLLSVQPQEAGGLYITADVAQWREASRCFVHGLGFDSGIGNAVATHWRELSELGLPI